MKLIDNLVEISTKPLSPKIRFLAKALPVFVFFFFFPMLLFILPKYFLDTWLHLPTFFSFSTRLLPAAALIVPGVFFLFTSTQSQREIGKGSPMPLNATQKLVTEKPYSYCRNPLYFGLFNFLFGISILIGSISSLVMVVLFSAIILFYIKYIEEPELEIRYGDEYLAYKASTPMLIPRLRNFRRK